MKSSHFDVLIVGAGPAGSFAAERLAKGGARVALFDGRPEGEPKACGGGVTAKALKAWPHLLNAVGRTVNDLEMYSPSGKRLHMKLDEPFAIYSRIAFDSYLRDRARDAGAEVVFEKITAKGISRTGKDEGVWKLRSASSGGWSGKMLVGADGANSAIAKKLVGPLPPAEMEVAFGYRAPLPACSEAATVVAFLPRWDGYAWAFPRPDHISFGIATSQITFDHEELEPLLWDFIIRYYEDRLGKTPLSKMSGANLESGKAKFGGRIEQYAARIPKLREVTLASRRTGTSEWALLGDAAGFADAVTGEGIYYALRSAELFAAAYADGCPESYESRWRKDFGRDLGRASKIRKRFYGNFMGDRFTERMIHLSILHGGIQQTLRDLVAGDLGYVNLKRKLVRRFVLPFGY
jgi:geranylgeranyl reductase family protein